MKKDNVILEKSLDFAVRIVKLSRYMSEVKNETIMSKQALRSGTSIGANVREAIYGQSRNDFIAKLSIALKETSETEYWIELLRRTDYLDEEGYESIKKDCAEIAKIITAIVKTTKG